MRGDCFGKDPRNDIGGLSVTCYCLRHDNYFGVTYTIWYLLLTLSHQQSREVQYLPFLEYNNLPQEMTPQD